MATPTKNAGKGMRPVKGYNYKKWYSNFDDIDWGRQPKPNLTQIDKTKKYAKHETT